MTSQGFGQTARTTTPAQGQWRVLRGLVLAVAALVVPAVAHVLAGGALPVDIVFILSAAGLAGACVAFADRRRGVIEIGAVVLLSQPVMHATLSVGGHHDMSAGGVTMVVSHVIAGVVVTALLSGAETMLWAWWALWTTVLWSTTMWADVWRSLVSTAGSAPRRTIPRTFVDPPTPSASGVFIAAPRRGPPLQRMV